MRKIWILIPIGLAACGPEGEPAEEESAGAAISTPSQRENGELGPLIPFHKDAIHAGLLPGARGGPKMLFYMRPSEYRGSDLVDPEIGDLGAMRETTFERRVYGVGFGFSSTLDHSVRTRIKADIPRENALIFDLSHPHAFKNTGKHLARELTEDDFALNAAAFSNAGHSRGLNYNLFCGGMEALADGRWLAVGGHDKGGNNGIKKINIFDPKTLRWKRRPVPAVKEDFLANPTATAISPGVEPNNEANTDPPHRSDMHYQRWYPSAVTLPDGRVLILSGTDQDTSSGVSDIAALTKKRVEVPEVYDPVTDTTVALKSAKKHLPMYPRSFVVQTGPGRTDWKVAVVAETANPELTRIGGYDPWDYNGKTHLFDVQAALRDPNRDVEAANHWELVDTALASHESGGSAAIFETDGSGHARSQKIAVFGGGGADGDPVKEVEMIDFALQPPKWAHVGNLVRPATQNNAVVLPDGKVIIVGGRGNGINTLEVQMFDPKEGDPTKAVRNVDTTNTIPRHDHSTALLMHDGSVLIMGGNRVQIVPEEKPNDGNRDVGVPVAQVYKPPYFFKGQRPRIQWAPDEVDYRDWFDVRVSTGHKKTIGSVVMVRMSPVTHNWSWGNRYVKLAFLKTEHNRIAVRTPTDRGTAPPGYYMLFVLDEDGVPSVAKEVRLGEEKEDDDSHDWRWWAKKFREREEDD